ncbi:DUF1612 domain-containing protein [Rhodobacterales bacterium]|nr:DUF1612 domain-containing protein [Rhodobacterales bacterium]
MNYYRAMKTAYDLDVLVGKLPFDRIVTSLDAAGRALTRADERIRRSEELSQGVKARVDFFDTCAAVALGGDLVHLEDLVLHDAGMDRRPPTHELTRAARLLHVRRRLAKKPPAGILTHNGILALTGEPDPVGDWGERERQSVTTDKETGAHAGAGQGRPAFARGDSSPVGKNARSTSPDIASAGPTDHLGTRQTEDELFAEIDNVLARSAQLARGDLPDERLSGSARSRENISKPLTKGSRLRSDIDDRPADRIGDWLAVLERARQKSLPEVLTAALLLDAWAHLQPLEGWPELGRFLVQSYLMSNVTPNHLSPLCVGLRKSPFRWRRRDPLALRLAGLLGAFERAASETLEHMDRLQIARDRLMRASSQTRKQSRLPEFAEMFLSRPLVTIPMARRHLGVTAAAVDNMIRQLGPALPRELTGRDRYRAWGIL